ncbi:HNH endonuclease [Schaalia sp. 19OD2882]|uniref:type II CRISPR RNA-guided endonuclease Cas9 n=1 Tax=Schaalia sp. 19OD2882 TaxID=2794089 RepID=UPI001C1EE624|nr:type II CRISPR RNA-guided endonuclease Cas9 [Schaalia sp. 19OD2882]QWW19337.1 HNH endonuclease [Schaalia sp. 19OD2882]
MTEISVESSRRYRVGIDVGTHSTGFCALEVGDDDRPISLLNSMVFIHDSGIDPSGDKRAETRKAVSGVARRTRRLIRTRRRRLEALDRLLESLGWPIIDLAEQQDPLLPWRTRALLLDRRFEDQGERLCALSIAVRHIARHRGWRSPYSRVESLLTPAPDSQQLVDLRERVAKCLEQEVADDASPGQVINQYVESCPTGKIRGAEGILSGKLMQSDNARELLNMFKVQEISDEVANRVLRAVFDAKSPRGSAAGRVGKDALPGQGRLRRAEKAHPTFQRFRIVSVLTNLRVREGRSERRLTPAELAGLVDYLLILGVDKEVTWGDLADQLGIVRTDLRGTAKQGPDGEPALVRPPVDVTSKVIMGSRIDWLETWWTSASEVQRGALVDLLSASGGSSEDSELDHECALLFETASEEDLARLDDLSLPQGRAAYSVDSLERLTETMLREGCDLTEARSKVFGVPSDWTPPAEDVGEPVGNPAVDRVLKQVSRWLEGALRQWGTPLSVNIEHVRHALGSERAVREANQERLKRERANEKLVEEMHQALDISGKVRRSDVIRYKAITRQNCQCLYCGDPITYQTMEMDHIVPRASGASSNTMMNLVAVCRRCNHSKGKIPFAVWAAGDKAVGVSVEEAKQRVRMWVRDAGMSPKSFGRLKAAVLERLKVKVPDEELDARSLESVAWMANELRFRIEHRFKLSGENVDVCVYRGALTAEARRASGFEGRVNLIGSGGKTRLDRRHHAMDALTIALMNRSVARTIALRMELRNAQRVTGEQETWKSFHGAEAASCAQWERWEERMLHASELFNLAITADAIPIHENIRLRAGSGAVHDAKVRKLLRRPLGSELTAELIERASTPALWTALTRHPAFDPKTGLPADPDRLIKLNGRRVCAADTIEFFPTAAACVAVRGGYALLGESAHHARIYKLTGAKKPTYGMVRVYQIDVAQLRGQDLFSAPLSLSSVSVRAAEPKVKQALANGTAEQVGWLVEGDELEVTPTGFTTGMIADFMKEYPQCTRWRVAGFADQAIIRLRPRVLSAEGEAAEKFSKSVRELLSGQGWRPAVNKLFGGQEVRVIRRNALGQPRYSSRRGLPSSGVIG